MVRAGTPAQGTRLLLGLGWVDTQCLGTCVCWCVCESVHMGVCACAVCMLTAALCLCARQLCTQSGAREKAAAASGVLGAGCYHTRSGTACN